MRVLTCAFAAIWSNPPIRIGKAALHELLRTWLDVHLPPMVERMVRAEIARYDLSEDASTETAMVFGELYRHGSEWKFRAVGQGYASGLAGIARDFGVNI